jgi:hypothetical protein
MGVARHHHLHPYRDTTSAASARLTCDLPRIEVNIRCAETRRFESVQTTTAGVPAEWPQGPRTRPPPRRPAVSEIGWRESYCDGRLRTVVGVEPATSNRDLRIATLNIERALYRIRPGCGERLTASARIRG